MAKRNQRTFDVIRGNRPLPIFTAVVAVVQGLADPYTPKPGPGGLAAYPPKAMAAACILKNRLKISFRDMAARLRRYPDDAKKMGFGDRTPPKSALAMVHQTIPYECFKRVNHMVVRGTKAGGLIAGDAAAFSESVFDETGGPHKRKSGVKLNATIDTNTRVILDFDATGKDARDANGLPPPLKDELPAPRLRGVPVCLDSAYLVKEILRLLGLLGAVPFTKPKSNTGSDTGDQTWRDMMEGYGRDPEGFFRTYHRRSVMEAVFEALKTMYGNGVKCRKPESRRNGPASRVICHNIEAAARV